LLRYRKHRLKASATVESAVLIPLATVVILVCLKMNIRAYDNVAAESAGLRGALKVEQEEPDAGERTALEQSIREAVDDSTLMLSDPEVEIIENRRSTGVKIEAVDSWRIPFIDAQAGLSRTEQFVSRSPADFIRLAHTISKQISMISGEKDDGVHDGKA
jgi:hypothetical protein